jgi:predicted nicotinamide N-methyase
MSDAKKNAHSKSSIVLTDCEEVSFASVFSDMFADDAPVSIEPARALAASRADNRGATSVEFIFGEMRMPMRANSDEVTKLQGHISALIWRSSLLASSIICGCTAISVLDDPTNAAKFSRIFGACDDHRRRLQGCDVLEVGCGRALAGKVCARLGANSVVLTDCDDRALQRLRVEFRDEDVGQERSCGLNHLLWEREQLDADLAALASARGADAAETAHASIRHWADAYRLAEEFPYINPSSQFDLIIASDCLYFHVQEEPLAATLHRRLRKPDGVAMIIVETRGNGAFQLERFLLLLRGKGFATVMCDSGPWDFDELVRQHIQNDLLASGAPCVATTGHEQNGPHVILVSWR